MRAKSFFFPFLFLAFLRGAEPSKVEGFSFIKSLGGIGEYRLEANHLTVLLLEDHSTPVLTFMVTYRVGSRNEVNGATGATHLLEHLMFKGSKNYNRGLRNGFDTMMDAIGARNNASTWLDRTNYYEILPSNHIETAVAMEADRMRNLLLRESDRQPEMTVVRNEFERGENDPFEALDKEITAAAFIAHPYHHPTIGWRSDIEKVSIEKLREFYDTFYWPNNATVTVIGDFSPENALRLIGEHYGAIPAAPHPIPDIYTEEPEQTGPRRVVVRRPGEVGVVGLAYKSPAALDADHPALAVLANILGDGKTSRFYRALIDASLAINVDVTAGFFRDPSLFQLYAMLAPGATHEQVEEAALAEIGKVKAGGVTEEEVSRALNKMLAGIAYERDGSFAIAAQLNEAIAVGDWTCYVTLPEKLKVVTAADVNRVARDYLQENRSTTGWFIPAQEGGESGAATKPPARLVAPGGPRYYRSLKDAPGRSPLARAAPAELAGDSVPLSRASPLLQAPAASASATGAGALIASKVSRREVSGMDVLTLKTSIENVVTLRGSLSGGDTFNPPGNTAIAELTAAMLDKGTVAHDKFALAEILEQTGAELAFSSDTHTVDFHGRCLRKDLPLVIGLLAEQLRTPRFDTGEFAKLKTQLTGRYRRALEDTNFRATEAFNHDAFPPSHPNHRPPTGRFLADIEAAALDQVKAFHAANYGPASCTLVAVGDVDDAALDTALRRDFAGWNGGKVIPAAAKAPPLSTGRADKIMMPGKASVTLLIGQPTGLRYADPDYLPLHFGASVFGGGFFSARLLDIVRNREGLTYGIYVRQRGDTFADGSWCIQGTFAPELLEKGIASAQRELRRFRAEGITAGELNTFKTTLSGVHKVQLATTGGLAGALLGAVQRGFGPEWLDEYPRRIDALTLEQVNTAIEKHLHPDRMLIVMAGTLPENVSVRP